MLTSPLNAYRSSLFQFFPAQETLTFARKKIQNDDVARQRYVKSLWLAVTCARKFKTEYQPIRDLHGSLWSYVIRMEFFGSKFRRASSAEKFKRANNRDACLFRVIFSKKFFWSSCTLHEKLMSLTSVMLSTLLSSSVNPAGSKSEIQCPKSKFPWLAGDEFFLKSSPRKLSF